MIDLNMIDLLVAFSVAVWALMNKTPVKALVKMLATRWHGMINARWPNKVSYDDFERYTIQVFAALIALCLIGIARAIDMTTITENLSTEWQWLNNAELISSLGVIFLFILA